MRERGGADLLIECNTQLGLKAQYIIIFIYCLSFWFEQRKKGSEPDLNQLPINPDWQIVALPTLGWQSPDYILSCNEIKESFQSNLQSNLQLWKTFEEMLKKCQL